MTGVDGKPLPHDSAHLHVTGRALYCDDIPTARDCSARGVWNQYHSARTNTDA